MMNMEPKYRPRMNQVHALLINQVHALLINQVHALLINQVHCLIDKSGPCLIDESIVCSPGPREELIDRLKGYMIQVNRFY